MTDALVVSPLNYLPAHVGLEVVHNVLNSMALLNTPEQVGFDAWVMRLPSLCWRA